MWFEQTTARSHYANGQYREALKELWHVTMHAEHMVQDLYDYYGYSMRRFTLQAFEDMLTFADNTLYKNRTMAQTAISLIRLEHKVGKIKDEELEKMEPQFEEWKQTQEYADLQKKLSEAEDEDEYKNDDDPKGFKLYKNLLEGKYDIGKFVTKVTDKNKDPVLHAKALPFYIKKGKILKALKSAILLSEEYPSHPKTVPALAKLFSAWLNMSDADKKAQTGKDSRLLEVAQAEITGLGCPASADKLPAAVEKMLKAVEDPEKRSLEACHEKVKLFTKVLKAGKKANFEQEAVKALNDNPMHTLKVFAVVDCHKSLLKTPGFKDSAFKTKAKELFPYSTYFESI